MTIKWRTQTNKPSKINYGLSAGVLTNTANVPGNRKNHEVEITGLTANTVYHYEIDNATSTNVNLSSGLTFKTYPAIGTPTPLRAWVLGDCGTADINARKVRNSYNNTSLGLHTDMILFLGDNAYPNGTDAEYQAAVFENMYEENLKNTVSWATLGNHDGSSANSNTQSGPYYDIFSFPTAGESGGAASGTEAYYSYDFGNIHFIVLDSYESSRAIGGAQYNWAFNDIQNTNADWIIAFWHHPPYTKGSHNSDNENILIQMRQNFLPMLESCGVDLVLSGHSHSYERSYYLQDHYGNSSTFDPLIHTIDGNGNGDGDGRIDGDGIYCKNMIANSGKGSGTVYITSGSSGKISGGALNHAAMYAGINSLASSIIEIDGYELDLTTIDEDQNVIDYFTIHKTPFALPSRFIEISSSFYNDAVHVNWNMEENEDADFYEVERSVNRLGYFEKIDGILARGENGTFHYKAIDADVKQGNTYYYRVKQFDKNGEFVYSNVINTRIGVKLTNDLIVSPNPVQSGGTIRLLTSGEGQMVEANLYDSNGRLVNSERLKTNIDQLDIPSVPPGSYILEVNMLDKTRMVKRIAIN